MLFTHRRERIRKAEEQLNNKQLPSSIDESSRLLKERFFADENGDLILRLFNDRKGRSFLIAYINGMADDIKINDFILKPLMEYEGNRVDLSTIKENVVRVAEAELELCPDKLCESLCGGMTALFSEGERGGLLLETRGYEKRSVDEAKNESVVLGPKESFNENMRTNITLIRRLIHAEDLTSKIITVGSSGSGNVSIVYLAETANRELLKEVERRLRSIDTNVLITSGVIEQLIEDKGILPLPRVLSTERPDRAASHILNGRIAILTEGSPFALVVPITFASLMNSPEDVYLRPPLGTLLRAVRYVGAMLSVLMPAYFLSLALYHQGMLTTEVLSTVIASRKMVFEPIAIELLMLLLIFQMIREAGLRVPGPIGQAIGIIGGLIMGQAAVTAHLASSVVLIIVAASGLGNFCIPDYSTQLAASYFRIALVIAAWAGGLLGVTSAVLTVCLLMSEMKSFGMPYLSLFAAKGSSKRPFLFRGKIGS